jgi:TolB-like protein
VAPVSEEPSHSQSEALEAPRLSIVVLPFGNIGQDKEQDYLADGITETLITDLWRIPHAFVIARNTAFAYKGKQVDARQIGRELGVRYVLEGSVQSSEGFVRVNAQLIDAETGAHLWAERFDRSRSELFDMQDAIVARLARAMDAELTAVEAKRSERLRNTSPDSVDLVFRGWAAFNRAHTPDNLRHADHYFEQALALAPQNVEALTGQAIARFAMVQTYTVGDRAARIKEAEAAAVRALEIEPNNARAHAALGWIYIGSNRPLLGIAEHECAIQLDRNQAASYAAIGWAKPRLGRAEETDADIAKAFRLSPKDSYAFVWCYIAGMAKLALGRTHEAVAWLRRSIELNRAYPIGHFALASALALQGRLDDARAEAAAGFALVPNFTVRRYRDGASSDNAKYLVLRERIYEGLRLAGVPEGDEDIVPESAAEDAPPTPALSTLPAFAAALKRALTDYGRSDLLARNPLLKTRLVQARGGGTPQELQALIRQTTDSLFAGARDEKLRRVIDRTYLHPAAKQEVAAEALGLSFSTYRRHLATARDRLAQWLWDREQELR